MHAADRWASAIIAGLDSACDPKTLSLWGRAAGAAGSTITAWCRAAGISPRESLYFCRMLRAVVLSRTEGWDPQNLLNIVDRRTLKAILAKGGLNDTLPTLEGFLGNQRLVTQPKNVDAIRRALNDSGVMPNDHELDLISTNRSSASHATSAFQFCRASHSGTLRRT